MIDTGRLLDDLQSAVRRDAARHRRRQRVVTGAAMLLTALIAGVGIAGTYDDWWTGAEPVVQPDQVRSAMHENDGVIPIDLSKKATVARTDEAALVAVETRSGGFCMSLFLASGRGMGSSCDSTPVEADGTGSAYATRADDSHWIAYGRMTDAGATAVDLSDAGLPARVPLERGGFFLIDIPRTEWSSLDGRSGDIAILDGAGRTIRRSCIYVGIAPGSAYAGGGGLGDAPGRCKHLAPIIPDPELDRAERLVALTLTRPYSIYPVGATISLWRAPNRGGGTCWLLVPGVASPGDGRQSMCGSSGSNGVDRPTVAIGDGLASGWVPAGSRIVRITINGADAAMAKGAFLAQVGNGPWRVVSYDSAGREVSTVQVPG